MISSKSILAIAGKTQKRGLLRQLGITEQSSRRKRGTGSHAQRKAARLARLPRVLELLGVSELSENIIVKATPGKPNGWEQKLLDKLELEKRLGLVADYMFEPITFLLPGGVRYTPDALVRYVGTMPIQVDEVKGQRRSDGIARFKIAAALFPQFHFDLLELVDEVWRVKRVYGMKGAA